MTTRATGATRMRVTWDAPWFAGSSAVSGYEVALTESAGRCTTHDAAGDSPSLVVDGLTPGETYVVRVAARNDQGQSAQSDPSAPALMDFSASRFAADEVASSGRRAWRAWLASVTTRRPTGDAARAAKDRYREMTQEADDRYEPLRSYHRDEGRGWVPPSPD